MDEEEPNERPMDNITDVMMKSMMGTSMSTLDSRLTINDNGKKKQMQMDSGCCGMSMLSSPAYFCYGLADGNKINIHTAEKGTARKAKAYGIAAGSVPALTDIKTREAGPRKAIRTGPRDPPLRRSQRAPTATPFCALPALLRRKGHASPSPTTTSPGFFY
jgi:hypothetical protein